MWLGNVGVRLQGNYLLEKAWFRCAKVRTNWPRIITLRRVWLYKEFSESTYVLHGTVLVYLQFTYYVLLGILPKRKHLVGS